MANNIMFLLSFTIFRIINLPWCLYKQITNFYVTWGDLNGNFQKACFVYGAAQVLILTVLNFYWYYKVIMMTAKSFGLLEEKLSKEIRKPQLKDEDESQVLELSKFDSDDHVPDQIPMNDTEKLTALIAQNDKLHSELQPIRFIARIMWVLVVAFVILDNRIQLVSVAHQGGKPSRPLDIARFQPPKVKLPPQHKHEEEVHYEQEQPPQESETWPRGMVVLALVAPIAFLLLQ